MELQQKIESKVSVKEEKKRNMPFSESSTTRSGTNKQLSRRQALADYIRKEGPSIARKNMLRAETSTAAFPEHKRPPYHQRLDQFIEHTNSHYFDEVMELQGQRIRGHKHSNKSPLTPQPVICLFLHDKRTGKEFCMLGTSGQPTSDKDGHSVASRTIELLKQVAKDLNTEQPGTYHVWDLPEVDTDPRVEVSVEIDFSKKLRQLCSPKLRDHIPWSYPVICGEPNLRHLFYCHACYRNMK